MSDGAKAWLGLIAYVIGYDVFAAYTDRQTLSSAFWEAWRHPKAKWVVLLVWSYLTAHLFDLLQKTRLVKRCHSQSAGLRVWRGVVAGDEAVGVDAFQGFGIGIRQAEFR